MEKKLGLVLTGGGARAAYQAGVILAINELLESHFKKPFRPQILAGASSGSINAAYLASKIAEPAIAIKDLWKKWETIQAKDVFDASTTQLASTAIRLILQLGAGGLLPDIREPHLLNTLPLRKFLGGSIDFELVRKYIEAKELRGLAITLTNYGTGSSVTFFDATPDVQPWMRSHRFGRRVRLRLKHVLASAAIPILFPPIRIGGSYYGDGAMRMSSPLSPAIHLGAEKILAIGMRYHRTPEETYKLNAVTRMKSIHLAEIAGTLLNSLFLDALDSDLERMLRINQTLKLVDENAQQGHPEKLRIISVLAIRPSRDLGKLAVKEFKNFSPVLRHMLRGLGASDQDGSDFISYLAFERSYTSQLLELGYQDVMNDRRRVLDWFQE